MCNSFDNWDNVYVNRSLSRQNKKYIAGHKFLKRFVNNAPRDAWKTQCACVPSLLTARICQCLPQRIFTRYQNKLLSGCEIQKKQAPHTKDKLTISRTQSLLIALVSLFCSTYFPLCTKGENHVLKSTLALAALHRSPCCCLGYHVAELGQCESTKTINAWSFHPSTFVPSLSFHSEVQHKHWEQRCTNFFKWAALLHDCRELSRIPWFNVSCFEVLDANKVRF